MTFAGDMTPDQRLAQTTAGELAVWYAGAVQDGMGAEARQAEIRRRTGHLPIDVRVAIEEKLGEIFGESFRRAAGQIPIPEGDLNP